MSKVTDEKSPEKVTTDEIFKEIGEFGKY